MMRAARASNATSELANRDLPSLVLDEAVDPSSLPGPRKSALGHSSESARPVYVPPAVRLDVETLRRHAWEIGSRRSHAKYVCPDSYVNLCAVSPGEAFAVWRLQPAWVHATAERKREVWQGARLVIRLYDVSFIEFNGFNAHRIRDVGIDGLAGERLMSFPLSGTTQLAEIGYLLRHGEFVPGARSCATVFPAMTVSASHDVSALYVDDRLAPEPVASPWEGASYLRERSKPRLRKGLRIAMLSFHGTPGATSDAVGTFVGSLAGELAGQGMEVHVLAPGRDDFREPVESAGVRYHPLQIGNPEGPVDAALAFARALEAALAQLPSFDYFHMQDWMTALVPWLGTRPATVALSSIEATRRNGTPPTDLSREVERLEGEVARAAECLIVAPWLRERALGTLRVDDTRLHAFPMEGRPMDEWESPFDAGKTKVDIGLGPLDRVLSFVGPLEWGAGPDLIVDALPTVLARSSNARVVFVGCGDMHGAIAERAHRMGVGHAIRMLGHVPLPRLIPLLRASEALLMPSRHRVGQDHGVVGLARRAGIPVLTTHGGPAQLVRHEQDGLVVYDNPPSLVWGMSRLLEDRRHAEDMGQNGLQQGDGASWSGVARAYADLCATSFAELRETAEPRRSSKERGLS